MGCNEQVIGMYINSTSNFRIETRTITPLIFARDESNNIV